MLMNTQQHKGDERRARLKEVLRARPAGRRPAPVERHGEEGVGEGR